MIDAYWFARRDAALAAARAETEKAITVTEVDILQAEEVERDADKMTPRGAYWRGRALGHRIALRRLRAIAAVLEAHA